jgi:hypothetical protein
MDENRIIDLRLRALNRVFNTVYNQNISDKFRYNILHSNNVSTTDKIRIINQIIDEINVIHQLDKRIRALLVE